MKNKTILNLRVLMIAIAILLGSSTFVLGQKKPSILKKGFKFSARNKDHFKKLAVEYKNSACTKDPSCTPAEALKAEKIRNKLILLSLAQTDYNFRNYRRKGRIGNNLFQIAMDILEIGASTAVGIINGERAKSVIGESLTLLQGARATAVKNLRLLERQILYNKMIAERSKVKQQIFLNIKKPITEYPFEFAYLDLVDYFLAGTMDHALASLDQSTSESAAKAEKDLAAIKTKVGLGPVTSKDFELIAEIKTSVDSIIASFASGTPSTAQAGKLQRIFVAMNGDKKLSAAIDSLKLGATTSQITMIDAVKDTTSSATGVQYKFVLKELALSFYSRLNSDTSVAKNFQFLLKSYK